MFVFFPEDALLHNVLIATIVFLMVMVEFSVGKENTERRHDQLALPSNIRK